MVTFSSLLHSRIDSENQFKHKEFIENKATNYLKGVALIFMFFHHFFTFPEYWIPSVSYPYLAQISKYTSVMTRICVPVFAFLTGYFYWFNTRKNYKYSFRKITSLWISYLIVFAVLLIPCLVFNLYDFSWRDFLAEVFVIKTPTMKFCWYVLFYFIAMVFLPIFAKIAEKSSVLSFLLSLFIPAIIIQVFNTIMAGDLNNNVIVYGLSQIINDLSYIPCVTIGYLFAKHKIFVSFSQMILTSNRGANIIISIFLVVFSCVMRKLRIYYDFFLPPLFVFGLMIIYYEIENKKIFKPFSALGKYSMVMWFLHSLFFNQLQDYTQPILYFPKNPLLVTVWGLLICLLLGMAIMVPIKKIVGIIKL